MILPTCSARTMKIIYLLILSILPLGMIVNPLESSHAAPAQPQFGFTVNMKGDGNDLTPGDGTCDASPETGEQCTLRAAVEETNALSGEQEITLPAGTYLLVGGAGDDDNLSGDLDIKGDLTINGAGADATIIDGGGNDRIFQVHQSINVTINNLTVRNGNTNNGGGIAVSFANLTLNNMEVISNTATQSGGGIFLNGVSSLVTVNNCEVLHNIADARGGGLYIQDGKLNMVESLVSDNQTTLSGSEGGGIRLQWSHGTTISRSTISHNNSEYGGGIFVDSNGQTVSILNSSIDNNSAINGGGLHSIAGNIVVGNTTISSNRAKSYGGGVYANTSYPAEVTMKFYNATIYGNRARVLIGNLSGSGGGLYNDDSSISIKNSILAGNTRGSIFPVDDDCKGTLISQDYSLIEETAGCTITGGTHDQTGVDPMLEKLADNGGPTRTHMPQAGSPVIDKANPAGCTDAVSAPLATDQRGYARTVDGDGISGAVCDIGAVEFALNPVPTLTSLNPASTQAGGGGFTLTVTGSDFADGAVVRWNGASRTTTFVSETQLSAQINAVDIASQGSAFITVLNPEPGGGVSNALAFSITGSADDEYKIYLPMIVH